MIWLLLMIWMLTPPLTPPRRRRGEAVRHAGDDGVLFMVPEARVAEVCGGMDEAYLLKLVRDWCASNERLGKLNYWREGAWWAVQPYTKWAEQMTWLSARQVGDRMRKLEERGLVIGVRWKKNGVKGWRVDEAALKAAVESVPGNVVTIEQSAQEPVAAVGQDVAVRNRITPVRNRITPIRNRITPDEKTSNESFKRINSKESMGMNQSSTAHDSETDFSIKGIDFDESLVRRFGLASTAAAYEKAIAAGADNVHAYANRCLENEAKQRGNPLKQTLRRAAGDGVPLWEQDGERFITGKYAAFIDH